MRADQAVTFLRALYCERISVGAKWVRSTCPLGRHTHSYNRDKIPSFAIAVDPEGESRCRCQACGAHGSLISLLWRLDAAGEDRSELLPYLAATNRPYILEDGAEKKTAVERVVTRAASSYAHWDRPALIEKSQSEVEASVLEGMREALTDDVREYLTRRRGLAPWTVASWELGWSPEKSRLCVPIRDRKGKLVSISGRLLVRDDFGRWTDELPKTDDGPRMIKYLHSEFRRNLVLYGMHKLDSRYRVAFLHEGFFQTIATSQLGYRNAFARMGTHLSPEQIDFLEDHFDHLVIVPDGDKMGRKSADEIVERLRHRKRPISKVSVAVMPDGKDADQLASDELRAILENSLTT